MLESDGFLSGRRDRSREHEDVEQLGAGSRTQGVEALTELALEFLGGMRVSAFAACSATA